MFEKDLKLALLYDRYAPLLSEKKRNIFEAYFSEDLSLAEIAQETGTSRQAVQEMIRRISGELRRMEEALGMVARKETVTALCRSIEQIHPDSQTKALLDQILENS